jgi:hypothetical protein
MKRRAKMDDFKTNPAPERARAPGFTSRAAAPNAPAALQALASPAADSETNPRFPRRSVRAGRRPAPLDEKDGRPRRARGRRPGGSWHAARSGQKGRRIAPTEPAPAGAAVKFAPANIVLAGPGMPRARRYEPITSPRGAQAPKAGRRRRDVGKPRFPRDHAKPGIFDAGTAASFDVKATGRDKSC